MCLCPLPLHQEWGVDHMVIVGSVQHVLWDRLPGPAAKLQQPGAPPRGPHLRGQEPGRAVSWLCLQRCWHWDAGSIRASASLDSGPGMAASLLRMTFPPFSPGSVMKTRLARCPSSGLPGAPGASAAATVEAACSRAVVLARMATRARVVAW